MANCRKPNKDRILIHLDRIWDEMEWIKSHCEKVVGNEACDKGLFMIEDGYHRLKCELVDEG